MRIRKPRILVVGREDDAARALVAALRARPFQVLWTHDDESAANALAAERVDALIVPLRAPRIDGLALLRRARARYSECCVVLVAESGEVERAAAAMREGASGFESAGAPPEKLVALLERAFAQQAVASRLEEARARLDDRFGLPRLVAHAPAMRRVLEQVAQVAASRVPVLLEGPAGSGKRTLAQAIHQGGPRRDEPFVWVACDALPADEAEAELFGRVAQEREPGRAGRFARAEGGTLFLGEVASLPAAAQGALLRALHDGGFVPVGGREPQRADVRLIAATRLDLAAEVGAGRFRSDLNERLGVVRIRVPALEERREDLPLLVESLLLELGRERGRKALHVTRGAIERLAAHRWPGNVRELRQTLEAMLVVAEGRRTLAASDLPAALRAPAEDGARLEVTVGMTVGEVERRLIAATLRATGDDKRRAAALLGIGLRTLYRKLREYGFGDDSSAGPARPRRPRAAARPKSP
jgi:DNA-binding NtrC family response regulator